jgi:hypothetical protein
LGLPVRTLVAAKKTFLITNYPQPANWSTKHEHVAVLRG